jgi:uncharacterized protein YacL
MGDYFPGIQKSQCAYTGGVTLKYFMKINSLSIIFAVAFFLSVEFTLNTYRIARIIDKEIEYVSYMNLLLQGIGFIALMGITYLFISSLREIKGTIYLSAILWIPYFLVFIKAFARFFPMTNRGEIPSAGTGLLLVGQFISYSFLLVALILFIS